MRRESRPYLFPLLGGPACGLAGTWLIARLHPAWLLKAHDVPGVTASPVMEFLAITVASACVLALCAAFAASRGPAPPGRRAHAIGLTSRPGAVTAPPVITVCRRRRGDDEARLTGDPATVALYRLINVTNDELARLGHAPTWTRGPDADTVLARCARCAGAIALGVTVSGHTTAESRLPLARGRQLLPCAGEAAR